MAKSKLQEKHTISVKGLLGFNGDAITVDVEDVGTKVLAELVKGMKGQEVAINFSYDNEIE